MAKRAQINEIHLYKISAGLRPRVEAETVRRLAKAFGTTTDYLLGMDVDDDVPLPASHAENSAPSPIRRRQTGPRLASA